VKSPIRVTQFDHSVDASPMSNANISFIKKRVVDISSRADEVMLDSILEIEDYQNDSNIIHKMDIEGDEWQVLDSIPIIDLRRRISLVADFFVGRLECACDSSGSQTHSIPLCRAFSREQCRWIRNPGRHCFPERARADPFAP
jgi:hypothetical protein